MDRYVKKKIQENINRRSQEVGIWMFTEQFYMSKNFYKKNLGEKIKDW